jgi:hypothetical protein
MMGATAILLAKIMPFALLGVKSVNKFLLGVAVVQLVALSASTSPSIEGTGIGSALTMKPGVSYAAVVAVDHPRRYSCAQRHSDIQNSRSCPA